MARRRKALFGCVLGSVLILVLLGMDFIANRLAVPSGDFNERLFRYDSRLGRAHRENVDFHLSWPEDSTGRLRYKTNNLGFREMHDTNLEKSSDYRVMVFGDSHTDGGVDTAKSFTNAAESILAARGADVEAINAGAGGFSLYQQLLHFEASLALEPDLAVFTLFCGNDYIDMTRRSGQLPYLELDSDRNVVEHPPLPEPKQSMIEHLARYSLMARKLRELAAPKVAEGAEKSPLQIAAELNSGAVWQGLRQAHYFNRRPAKLDLVSALHEYVVDRIKTVAQDNAIALLFIILPTKYQIERHLEEEVFAELEKILGLDPSEKVSDRVANDFTSILGRAEIDFLDPTSEFLAADEELYWKKGHHINTRGCELLGDLLADEIEERLHKR